MGHLMKERKAEEKTQEGKNVLEFALFLSYNQEKTKLDVYATANYFLSSLQ